MGLVQIVTNPWPETVSASRHHWGVADDEDLLEVVRRERQLLDPTVRVVGEQVEALLHPGFVEYGASGRVWDRPSIIDALALSPQVSSEVFDFSPVSLADNVVLLTYRLAGSKPSLRSSVWVRDQKQNWRLRFHQGTMVDGFETAGVRASDQATAPRPLERLTAGPVELRAMRESDWELEQALSHDAEVVRWTFYPEAMDEPGRPAPGQRVG